MMLGLTTQSVKDAYRAFAQPSASPDAVAHIGMAASQAARAVELLTDARTAGVADGKAGRSIDVAIEATQGLGLVLDIWRNAASNDDPGFFVIGEGVLDILGVATRALNQATSAGAKYSLPPDA
jgi:hypothetical protein